MARACPICGSEDRAEIENAILNMTSSGEGRTIEQIAEAFNVDLEKLKLHAMFHTPLVSAEELEPQVKAAASLSNMDEVQLSSEDKEPAYRDSLTRKMRLRETDVLNEVTNEYLITLKAMGRRINKLISVKDDTGADDDQTYRMSKLLTRPVVDLYIGLGGEIRQTVKTIADIDRAINGPQNDPGAGLAALANAIRGSDTE